VWHDHDKAMIYSIHSSFGFTFGELLFMPSADKSEILSAFPAKGVALHILVYSAIMLASRMLYQTHQ